MTTNAQIEAFLACKRIGFVGVSSNPGDFSRDVFREFVKRGYEVVPIHPIATEIEGRPAFASLIDAGPLDAVYVMTPSRATESVVKDCYRAGIRRVWLHRGIGSEGSVEWHAVQYAKAHGISVIDGECALMFLPNTSVLHRMHGAARRAFGHYPDVVEEPTPHRARKAAGYGVLAWTLATWATLTVAGLFAWNVGMTARLVIIPVSLGFFAWLYAGPGQLSPWKTAITFIVVGAALDAIVFAGLLERSLALFASGTQFWLPYALAFVAAVWLGTRHHKPVRLRVLYSRAA